MHKLSIVVLLAASLTYVSAYGGYGGYDDGGYGHDDGVYGHGAIDAAVISHHSIHHVPHYSKKDGKTTHVHVDGGVAPIKMHFSSYSSPVMLTHSHKNRGPSYHKTMSHDGPQVSEHLVYKPVYHKLTEIVVPYKHTQQIVQPVKHSMKTLVHSHHGHGYGHHGYGHQGYGHQGYGHHY